MKVCIETSSSVYNIELPDNTTKLDVKITAPEAKEDTKFSREHFALLAEHNQLKEKNTQLTHEHNELKTLVNYYLNGDTTLVMFERDVNKMDFRQ